VISFGLSWFGLAFGCFWLVLIALSCLDPVHAACYVFALERCGCFQIFSWLMRACEDMAWRLGLGFIFCF